MPAAAAKATRTRGRLRRRREDTEVASLKALGPRMVHFL
jgi:hypothetical protein